MGTYNILICDAACPRCNSIERFKIQFQYGHLRLDKYEIGSTIFFKNLPDGSAGTSVKIDGIGGPCPNCLIDYIEFDIYIDNNVVISVNPHDANSVTG